MNSRTYLFLILFLGTLSASAQRWSLRELLATADIVAITASFPDPFFPDERKIAFSDHKTMTAVDSVQIISYLKKGKKAVQLRKLYINTQPENSFFDNFSVPPLPVEPVSIHQKPPVKKTLLFARSGKDYTEVLYFVELNEEAVAGIKDFMAWTDTVQQHKSESMRCKLYIEKYLSMLEGNNLGSGFCYFDNILLPGSDFMIYYRTKAPEAVVLTTGQKEQLKNYLFEGNCFGDIETTRLLFQLYPEETLKFYQDKLSGIRVYDDEFERDADEYTAYLRLILEKTNRLDSDAVLFLDIMDDYSTTLSTKRDIFQLLIEKMNITIH